MIKKMFSIKLDENDQKIINDIKLAKGIEATAQVFKLALREWHDTIFLDYRRQKAEAQSNPRQKFADPVERLEADLKRKEEEDKAKIALANKRAVELCEQLGGNIIMEANGSKACQYKTYEKIGQRVVTGSRKVYFDTIHQNHLADQYRGGTKEEIQTLLADPENA